MSELDPKGMRAAVAAFRGKQGTWEDAIEAAITAYLSTVSPLSDGDGYIAGNGEQTRWRAWEAGECMWTEDPAKATRFARREDAEAVHYDDDAVWCIKLLSEALPAPTPPTVNSGDKTR